MGSVSWWGGLACHEVLGWIWTYPPLSGDGGVSLGRDLRSHPYKFLGM